MFLFKTKVTFLLERYQKPFVDPVLATLVGFGSARQYGFSLPFITKAARLPSTSTAHNTPDGVLRSAQDDTGRFAPLRPFTAFKGNPLLCVFAKQQADANILRIGSN